MNIIDPRMRDLHHVDMSSNISYRVLTTNEFFMTFLCDDDTHASVVFV